jgi:hypothetical protein
VTFGIKGRTLTSVVLALALIESVQAQDEALWSFLTVDIDATNGKRVVRIAAGRVPVENLREAVWMMLFRGEAERVQLNAEYVALPAGFVPQVKAPARRSGDSFSVHRTLYATRDSERRGSCARLRRADGMA